MLSRWKSRKDKNLVWVYKRKVHKNHTIGPEKPWWKHLDGIVVDFWKYDDKAYVDVLTKQTITVPNHYKHANRLVIIKREWCKPKWV